MTLSQPILRPMSFDFGVEIRRKRSFYPATSESEENPMDELLLPMVLPPLIKSFPQNTNRRGLGNNGGGESDAAFTPSPPAPISNEPSSRNFSHQSRIRNLSPRWTSINNDIHPVLQNMYQRRPDSSSSASSATDWKQFGNENGTSPYTDLSRRDEGDGRSIADSQCSTGSYSKKDIQTSSPPMLKIPSNLIFYLLYQGGVLRIRIIPLLPYLKPDQVRSFLQNLKNESTFSIMTK
ncbi:Tetratricopeptide repeat protein 28 [Sarracenia purpurea var. burkii]